MANEHSHPPHASNTPRVVIASVFAWFGRAAGLVAALATLVLAASVLLGIILRWLSIDNTWAYDLDHFVLIWLAFVGAAYTGYRGAHVTAGISLEHLFKRGALALAVLRFVIVAAFLAVLIYSGASLSYFSWTFHELTSDAAEWPVWVAKLALPVGSIAWLAGEVHRFLIVLAGATPPDEPAD